MNEISMRRSPLFRAMMFGTTALTLLAPIELAARVGVTSATDGDPMGRPPSANERVLRIGVDVQANEAITTRANDRAHLVFLDGSSLTVGPNAQLTIDKFVFDPATKTGDLAINASKGVFRLVGGKISKTNPIVITTPSSTIGIRGGITIFDVQPTKTVATFVFGTNMTVNGNGQTVNVVRPGSTVSSVAGSGPGQPTMATSASLTSSLGQLEGTSSTSSSGTGGSAATAEQKVQTGFSAVNSSQAPAAIAAPTTTMAAANTPGTVTTKIANSEVVNNATSTSVEQTTTERAAEAAIAQQGPPPAPPSQVIVTRGRFRSEPAYTNFNNQTLAVTPVPANNAMLQASGTLSGTATDGTATIALADGRSFTVPWKAGGGPFALQLTHPVFGALNGTGFVNASGTFFAYTFMDGSNNRMGFVGGSPTALADFPTSGFAKHSVSTLGEPGRLPFASSAVGNDVNLKAAATISSLFSTYSPNVGPAVGGAAPTTPQTANYLQGTVSIAGSGSGQTSYMGVIIGDYFRDYNTSTVFSGGNFNGTYRLGADQQIGRLTSSASTFDVGDANSIFGPGAETMVYSPSSTSSSYTASGGVVQSGTTTRRPQASFDQPYTNLTGSDYYVATVATKTSSSAADGLRTTRTMTGFAGGLVDKLDSGGNMSTRTVGSDAVSISTNAVNNRVFANITFADWDTAATMASFNLGATVDGPSATSSFYNDKIYAARDRPAGTFLNRLTSVSADGGDSDVTSRTALMSYNTAPVGQFFASQGVAPCSCEFMTWGWWTGDVRYNDGSSYNPNGRDRLNLATYVAGTLTTRSELNTLNTMNATATYTGHMVGNVRNGANSYVAAGTYANAWSFGTQTGRASVSFDGATYGNNYTANTALNGGGAMSFSTMAPIPSNAGPGLAAGRSLTLNGAFANAPGVVAKGQLGNFQITGSTYQAGGTFAAQKR